MPPVHRADRAPTGRRVRRALLRAAVAAALGISGRPAAPGEVLAQTTLTEAQLKAAFVLNFARYMEWPAASFAAKDTPVLACVTGQDTIGPALTALEGRSVQGRPLHVRRNVSLEAVAGCHVLFIAEAEERRVMPVLRAVAGQPVLTVSDSERFIEIGGHIGLVVVDERLQFEINRRALEASQLKAGAPLLKLARNLP